MAATNRRADGWQGALALMVLKTLDVLGPLHEFGIAVAVIGRFFELRPEDL